MYSLDLKSLCWPLINAVEKVSKATLENFVPKLEGQQVRPLCQPDTRHGRCWNRKQDKSVINVSRRQKSYSSTFPGIELEKSPSPLKRKLRTGDVFKSVVSSPAIQRDCSRLTSHGGKSRAWAAWNELQSTRLGRRNEAVETIRNSLDFHSNDRLRTIGTASDSGTNTLSSRQWLESDLYRNHSPETIGHCKLINARKAVESSIASGEAHRRDDTKSSTPLQAINDGDRARNASNHTCSQRQAAIRAIEQVLTPGLYPNREGRGDLELQLAGYLTALNSSALTNEADHCQKEVQTRLASMMQSIHRTKHDLKSVDSWLDVAETRLGVTPTRSDVLYLQDLLERSSSERRYPVCVREATDESSFGRRVSNKPIGSQKEMIRYIKQEVLQMEENLARLPNVCDIQRMRPRALHMEMEMNRHQESSRQAVRQLKHAVGRGEVAWFKNLDVSTSRLESLARVLVPLEATYKGAPATARV